MSILDSFRNAASKLKILLSPTVYTDVRLYLEYLENQVDGRWKPISATILRILDQNYSTNRNQHRTQRNVRTCF